MYIGTASGTPQIYTYNMTDTAIIQRTTDSYAKIDADFSPYFSDTGGEIIFTHVDSGQLKMFQVEMAIDGEITDTPRDLEIEDLSSSGARPHWGP